MENTTSSAENVTATSMPTAVVADSIAGGSAAENRKGAVQPIPYATAISTKARTTFAVRTRASCGVSVGSNRATTRWSTERFVSSNSTPDATGSSATTTAAATPDKLGTTSTHSSVVTTKAAMPP